MINNNTLEKIIDNKEINMSFHEILDNKVKENFITFSEIILRSLKNNVFLNGYDFNNIEKIEILLEDDLLYFGCFHINIFTSLEQFDSKNLKIVVPFDKNYIINTNNIIFYIMGYSGNIIKKICKYTNVEVINTISLK